MIIMDNDKTNNMLNGPLCPYCCRKSKLVDSSVVYNNSFGNIWICYRCDAWVGVHKNDNLNRPLGTLANRELREWRKRAHRVFDVLWKKKMEREGCSKSKDRNAGYKWLSDKLGISVNDCHIGMFDVDTCKMVVYVCERIR